MNPLTDLDLVQQVRNGKREAYTELMRRYQQRVYWVARRIVGNHDDADDIAQETFVKAYLALGDFRGDSGFFTWLYRIAVNLSLNTIRKQQVVNYLRESPMILSLLPAKDNPQAELEAKELESKLQRAVALLPEKQKAVFVMRYYEEMNYEEISEVLKTSVGGLKANYFHALKKVQEYLKDETATIKD
ncbi:MAG: sigma-70 family RNA polymerase sigma factor [Bacteroidetes bacterium]|nr:sigma-70 family RNA polymerase sigma factor [Bacteroidota bacterium]MCW5895168.1 sigma-70 family RNA polymerase sigma factor [Bacteroidota bacterium]